MYPITVAAPTAPSRLREARRQLIEQGSVSDGLVAAAVQQSWLRSWRFGLVPTGRIAGAPHASGTQLSRALERQRELVAHARPLMEFLFEHTCDSDSMVVLADAEGMVLSTLGDTPFMARAERVALRPGASWNEKWRGTNAIGGALAERAPFVVHGGEHYLERNAFLTCAAAPILDSSCALLGVLDVTGDRHGYHRHTLGLVRSAARMIEHRLFETRHGANLHLRLHARPEGIGTITEALLALSEEGRIVGANRPALALLGISERDIGLALVEALVRPEKAETWRWWLQSGSLTRPMRRADGMQLWVRVEGGQAGGCRVVSARPSVAAAFPGAPAERRAEVAAGALDRLTSRDALDALDTGDPAMRTLIERARRVLDKPIALLLQGESGVGKEVLARAFHASSERHGQPFVAVNCAALPESLIEAELFGYTAGAYTGARREGASGRIREADGGTLFLDEIGDMPLALQARLLRVLQERQVVPLGGGKPIAVDFRLICATHRQLREEIAAGRFREDLYYRLNGLTLRVPPLRERCDLSGLAMRLLREAVPERDVLLAPEVENALRSYGWPGNLRQLANVLRTACAMLDDDERQIHCHHLPDDFMEELHGVETAAQDDELPSGSGARECDELRQVSLLAAHRVLRACEGNVSEAARRLGISRTTLYRKLREPPAS